MKGPVLAALALALPGSGVPAALAAQAPGHAAPDTAPAMTHPELVVSVLRNPVRLDAVPYAVTVRTTADAVPTAGLSLASELTAIPGLQVQSRFNDALGDRIILRGFGARTQFGVRGIHVVVDGVPATMPDGQTTLNHLDLTRLTRAEVLRGPAAATYGNAAGGVLLLDTRPPPAAGFRQELGAAVGEGSLLRLRAASGGPVGASGAWSAALSREERDGYRPHAGTRRYNLTGRLDAPAAGGWLRATVHGVTYDADNPGSLTPDQFLADPSQAQAYNVAQGTGEEGRHGQLGVAWERPVGGVLVEGSAYGLVRSLENPIPPSVIDLDRRAAGGRVVLRSEGWDAGSVEWAVGADLGIQSDDRRNYVNEAGDRGSLTLDQRERVVNGAVHAQLLWPLLDRLGLLVAGRYDRISFLADDRLTGPGNPDDSGERTMDAISPTAGLRLTIAPGVTLFGNVSTAFETPTTTELVNRPEGAGGFNHELEPQRTVSYEAGGRARIASGFYLEATTYRANVRDALIPFEVASAPGRQYFRNAGEAVHQGVELLGELELPRLELLAALSLIDARFGAYETEAGSYDGNDVPGVRPWTFETQATVRPFRSEVEAGSFSELAVTMDLRATGAMAVEDANTVTAPGYELLNARVGGVALRLGGWSVEPYAGVQNLLDEAYVAAVVPNAFGGRYFEPGPPRSLFFGVELRSDGG